MYLQVFHTKVALCKQGKGTGEPLMERYIYLQGIYTKVGLCMQGKGPHQGSPLTMTH